MGRPAVVLAAALLGALCATLFAYDDVIHPSANDWTLAAQTGRADIFVLGDSVVINNGWMIAVEYGSAQTVGLAGTGVVPPGWQWGESWGYSTSWGVHEGWSSALADVPVERRNYVRKQKAMTAGPTSAGQVGI